MAIQLLAIASNYTGTSDELPDCLLDASNIVAALKPFCAMVTKVVGKRATRDGIRSTVRKFIASLKKEDLGIVYFSGHGTLDRVNGMKLGAIVCDGFEMIYETEMRADLLNRTAGSLLAAASDSCYSGALPRGRNHGRARAISIRHCIRHPFKAPTRSPKKPNAIFTASGANEVSYSTGQGGAWTNAFLEAFAERTVDTTLPALFKRIRTLLPSEWEQHPTFLCDPVLQRRTLKSFMNA